MKTIEWKGKLYREAASYMNGCDGCAFDGDPQAICPFDTEPTCSRSYGPDVIFKEVDPLYEVLRQVEEAT